MDVDFVGADRCAMEHEEMQESRGRGSLPRGSETRKRNAMARGEEGKRVASRRDRCERRRRRERKTRGKVADVKGR